MDAGIWTALIGTGLLLLILRSYRWQRRALRRRAYPQRLDCYPSVTVIRPIKGLDTRAEENIRAALDHGYPGQVETLFVFDDESDPALPYVVSAVAQRKPSAGARVLFAGQPPANRTGKLNAMIAGLAQAKHELVAFVDSDVRQDRQALRVLVETLMSRDGAGSAFAPVVVTEPPSTVGDVGYALMLNGLYGPAAAASADELGGELPFIMGQFMVFKREAIRAIGGLETAQGQLVDDMFLGKQLSEHGFRNVISPHAVAIIQRDSTLAQFAGTFVRWIAFSRSGLPAMSFKRHSWIVGMAFWAGLVGAAFSLAGGCPLGALSIFLAPLSVGAMVNDLHHRIGGAPLPTKYRWVAFALWLSAPLIYGSIFSKHEINWRGRRYQLDMHSRLG